MPKVPKLKKTEARVQVIRFFTLEIFPLRSLRYAFLLPLSFHLSPLILTSGSCFSVFVPKRTRSSGCSIKEKTYINELVKMSK